MKVNPVATGTTSIAHKGMLHAGKVMAATAAVMLAQPGLIEQAKQELKERLGNETYHIIQFLKMLNLHTSSNIHLT